MSYRVNALVREKPLRWYQLIWRRLFGPAVKPYSSTEPKPEFNAKWAKEVADKYVADVPKHHLFEEAMDEFQSLVEKASAQGCYYVAFEPFDHHCVHKKGVSEELRARLHSAFQVEVARLGFRYERGSPKDRIWWGRVELHRTHCIVFI